MPTPPGGTLAWAEDGEGPAVLALHGAYSTHAELRTALDPMLRGRRRIYPDLPGHGSSSGVTSAAEAVTALEGLIDHALGHAPVLVLGHSFGAHLARGLAARRPNQIQGLALICPLVPGDMEPAEPSVVADDGSAAQLSPTQADTFTGYFVIRTATTLARYRTAVAPALDCWDDAAVTHLMSDIDLDLDHDYPHPVLVMTGRQDAWVGYRQHAGLLEAYPRATSIVLADTGHALPHERPEALATALRHWLACSDQR